MLEEAHKKGRSDSPENRYLRRRPNIDSLREFDTIRVNAGWPCRSRLP